MSPTLTVCIVILTVAVCVGVGFLIETLLHVRRAARAVETLSYEIEESVCALRTASLRLGDFTSHIHTGWLRALGLGWAAVETLWPRNGKKSEARREAAGASPQSPEAAYRPRPEGAAQAAAGGSDG